MRSGSVAVIDLKLKITFNQMMTMKPCTRRTVATGEYAMVEQCTCGAVHMTIGPVTLRLAASAIGPIAATLSEAADGLKLEQSLGARAVHGEVH